MKNIKIALWGLLATLSALWLVANLPFPETVAFINVRNYAVQYFGVISIGAMSIAMILATRAKWLEPWLNGLDKSYRLHKWLGITALITSVIHWISANGPKWAVNLGLMDAPQRGPRPEMPDLGAVQTFLNSMRDPAEGLGEKAFYLAVILIVLALIKKFPYKTFASTHLFISVAYLVLVFHSVVLMNFAVWTQPLGIVTAILMTGGVVSAILSLTRQIGRRNKVSGCIDRVLNFDDMRITEVSITLNDGWKGHTAGQFAFVTFDKREGKHPFTIASAWDPASRQITFISKGLGDYTDLLHDSLTVGAQASVEGPYGQFTFDDTKKRQIWIGGGIGITPFIARMKQLAAAPGDQQIDLIHSTPTLQPEAKALLDADVAASGVNLHVLIDGQDGLLTGERLRQLVPDWKDASFWFCGPAGFGQALRKDLIGHGLAAKDFHQELFNMR